MKRFLAHLAVTLSVVPLVPVGGWVAHNSAIRAVSVISDAAGQVPLAAAAQVDAMGAHRERARPELDELSAELDRAARQAVATPPVFTAVDQLLEGRLAAALDELDRTGRTLYADVAELDAAGTAMNELIPLAWARSRAGRDEPSSWAACRMTWSSSTAASNA